MMMVIFRAAEVAAETVALASGEAADDVYKERSFNIVIAAATAAGLSGNARITHERSACECGTDSDVLKTYKFSLADVRLSKAS